ncbi:MAG: UDP-N-acetylmuramoyl-tripeptide--D-alanyl-D-alanine ligase [Porphyromonadaceae bacterium CG2_30_38_12]|nr:MAG: UDP-N-acetylmuramoyl-tripeptide--D-alanyl-D-alanine ligase [Porphyromonadaceae bacterium CG2_30_38_12]
MTTKALYEIFKQYPRVTTDSRNCPSQSLFFALKGDNFNANAFAAAALDKGCAYAIIDEQQYALDARYIVVKNVLSTLQDLARYHRKKLVTKLLAITGTNGKTTTKELIASVLSEKYNVLYTQGNLNNHIGVPLTLLQLTSDHDIAIIEMGANHLHEIKFLAEIACPDYGIVTNVGKAHIEGFGSFEGIMQTKGELYDYLAHHGNGIFRNTDNENLNKMATKAGFGRDDNRQQTYSLSDNLQEDVSEEKPDIHGKIISCSPFLNMRCYTNSAEKSFEIATKLIGAYNAENVLAAIAIGHYFDVSNEQIKHGLENYEPKNNRSQLTLTKRNQLVIDAYNANPTSMRAAIDNFAQMHVPNKYLILGDMLELGNSTASEHQIIIDILTHYQFEDVLLIGQNFGQTNHNFIHFEKVDEAYNYFKINILSNKFILLKASRGIHLEKLFELL